jgi:RND family efflux transporter MFP subunit
VSIPINDGVTMRSTLLSALLVFASATQAAPVLEISPQQMANLGVKLGKVSQVTQSLSSQYPAKVTIPNASQRVISAPQEGVVELMYVADGDPIKPGQALASLNSPQLLVAQSDYLQSLSKLSQLRNDMQRDDSLFKQGIIAERRLLQSKSAYQQQQTQVAMYRKALSLAGMADSAINDLRQSGTLNSHLVLTAKQGGVVMHQYAMVGQRLKAADPIYQVAKLDTLWLEIHAPVHIAKQLQVGDKLKICGKSVNGKVTALGRKIHQVDQGVLVRAEVREQTEHLTPGEFVEACFIKASSGPAFQLPRSALFKIANNSNVFVHTDKGFELRQVEILNETSGGDVVIVTGKLSADESIATRGIAALKAAYQQSVE